MLRSVWTDRFPKWLKGEVVRESPPTGSLTPLQSLQRRIREAEKARPETTRRDTPDPRSSKADPDRKSTAGKSKGPETSGAPVRDVREEPAPNPDDENAS